MPARPRGRGETLGRLTGSCVGVGGDDELDRAHASLEQRCTAARLHLEEPHEDEADRRVDEPHEELGREQRHHVRE